jgi:DNA polymerase III gamma/tau subunit
MYQRGSETSKILEDLMNIINWSCKLKINSNLIKDEFLTEDDKNFASYVTQYDHGKLNIFWQSLIKGYDEIKISPHPHSTLEMILLRCAFLLNDNPPDTLEEKKKHEIIQKEEKSSPNLDQAIENKVDAGIKISLKERIEIHQSFFQFYGKNFSPLMAGIIIEQCEVVYFSENEKKLKINVLTDSFQGSEELKQNFNKDFELDITVKKNIENLESIKILYKKELIEQEMKTDDFKKVLAKFPNAKIIDIEDIERGDENDG